MKYHPPPIPTSIQRGLVRAGSFWITTGLLIVGIAGGIPLWLVVAWRGTEPGPVELVLRGALVACSLGAGIVTFLFLIARLGRRPDTPTDPRQGPGGT
jgi:hypothetical protein